MTSIATLNSMVHFNESVYDSLNEYIKTSKPSKIFILVDTNTHDFCLAKFMSQIENGDIVTEVMEMPNGEDHKTIDICLGVWEAMSEHLADRKSLLINLGGGVVTDLGGFVASTYMRGIDYINVPTSLLAMVDASVGGKTGVDLGALKNHIGVINEGSMVLIDTSFLETLPVNEMVSGFAEMLKHGLIANKSYWNALRNFSELDVSKLDDLIYDSVIIKNTIVSQDQKEQGLRKVLNFGHTIGHAIESHFLENGDKTPLLHGEAIAIGMITESYISNALLDLTSLELKQISSTILESFKKVEILDSDIDAILALLKHDKKNSHGIVNFVLLNSIGSPEIDCQVSEELIIQAINYYTKL